MITVRQTADTNGPVSQSYYRTDVPMAVGVYGFSGLQRVEVDGSEVGERFEGTILYGNDGARLNRHAAARIVRRIAKAAGINKQIGPHALRHGFITAALDASLDAGVPVRDVQEAASHADPRTTMRYDRERVSLDRHATYIVSTLITGTAR